VEISNPRDPTEVHTVQSPATATRHADAKFDHRDGLSYRSLEGDETDFEVIDYDFDEGTLEEPVIRARADAGSTRNLFPLDDAPIVYTVDEEADPGGIGVWDVSDPADPTFEGSAGPNGDLHDVVVDPDRDLAHCAYIGGGDFAGYAILDTSDPLNPTEVGRFDYEGRPDYTEERFANGEPGFESCHYANYDPERGIAVVGDETFSGVPGGKHVFDIGWSDGSPSDPRHIDFTYSPNAELMDEDNEGHDWTGHNFDIVAKGGNSLLVSGDYHEGTVVYDISDPTEPTATDQYRTDDGANEEVNDDPIFDLGEAPMAWGADYTEARDLVVTSDFFTGVYTFEVTPSGSASRGSRR